MLLTELYILQLIWPNLFFYTPPVIYGKTTWATFQSHQKNTLTSQYEVVMPATASTETTHEHQLFIQKWAVPCMRIYDEQLAFACQTHTHTYTLPLCPQGWLTALLTGFAKYHIIISALLVWQGWWVVWGWRFTSHIFSARPMSFRGWMTKYSDEIWIHTHTHMPG